MGVSSPACLRPIAWLHRRPGKAQLQHQHRKTLARGQASRGGQCQDPRKNGPPQEGYRGAESSMQVTSRGLADVSHDDQGRAGTECRFPLRCKGGKPQAQSPEESTKGFHSGETRPRPPGRQDRGHRRAQRSVTTRGFSQVKTTFVRIDCTTCPLSNPAIVESLPAHIWEEDQGHYK